MSLTECDLRNERPERPGEFTFTWSIQNYSYCTKEEGEPLFSPHFVVEFLVETEWYLMLYPRGNEAPGFVSCFLCGRDEEATINFTLAIRMSNGQFKESGENVLNVSSIWNGYCRFVSLEELKGSAGYLDDDTLTVSCRMWKTGVDIPASVKWEAQSRIKVSKLDYTWILSDIPCTNGVFEREFKKSVNIREFFTVDTGTDINLQVYKEGNLSECSLQFGIEMIRPKKKYFWIAVVHLMDADGRVTHSTRGEHLFQSNDDDDEEEEDEKLLWSLSLILDNEANRNLYLHNNMLILRCELSFATDNELETFVFGITNEREIESTTNDKQSKLQRLWIKNMQECYKDGKFSDFIIRTPGKQFPVHRNILSAHSEVFDAMFERDMKERQTGIVDIEDLDDETVSKMLKYIYASTLDVSDCPSAQNLYFAADKYGIADLMEKCSSYLMSCLDASNVCDILELADRHEDKDLKSCARNFFLSHANEIMASGSWKKLKENNLSLACETVEWSISNMTVT